MDVCLKAEQTNITEFDEPRSTANKTLVWLGILTSHPDELVTKGSDSEILKIEQLNLGNQEKCLTWTVKEQPSHVAIDPFYNQLDQNRDNNVLVPVNTLLN